MIKVMVNGAKGRMGAEAANAIDNDPALNLVAKIDRGDDLATSIATYQPDVVVDFTIASAGFENTQTIINSGARPVVGTSGFLESQVETLSQLARDKNLGGLIAPNFSLGAVLMMKFAAEAARYLPDVEIVEAHSPQKEESPSGTALRTAELIHANRVNAPLVRGKELFEGARGAELHDIPLHSLRLPGVVAQQWVMFGGQSETLKIEHNSQHRDSFMPGVVLACKKVMEREELVYGLEHFLE